jgi:hypothetical protein
MIKQHSIKFKVLACALGAAGVLSAPGALAWGSDGHRAVGAMADRLLKGTRAEKQVKALLGGESLEAVANWADCVKGTYCGPQTPEMVEFVAANAQHNEYHYTNIPFQNTAYKVGAVGSAESDIVQTLTQAIMVLQGKGDAKSNPHNFTPRQALLLIAHMTGDIHQPLHVGSAYVGKDGMFTVPHKHEDIDGENMHDARGGNSLLLSDEKMVRTSAALIGGEEKALPAGVTRSLTKPFHSYWDTTVVDYAMRRLSARTPAQYAQMMIDAKPMVSKNTGNPASWPLQWANDSLLVSKVAYAHVTPGAKTAQKSRKGETYYTFGIDVPDNYPVPSSELARTQLTKGGYHLASLLRAIWP